MSKVQPSKAHTITDYELGKLMYRRLVSFEACTNERMQAGWNAAENSTAWGVYDDSPEDAVAFAQAEPEPWNASSAGVYAGTNQVPKTQGGNIYDTHIVKPNPFF